MYRHLPQFISFLMFFAIAKSSIAQTFDISGPAGSGNFGTVTVLANGNYVVSDLTYDEGAILNVGAVYLYNGSTHTLISTLKGSTAEDRIGSNGILALPNSSFLVRSGGWDNGAATNVGAFTWVNGTTGLSGVVSSSNSIIGSQNGDLSGASIDILPNGNYVISTPYWSNGGMSQAGAVTWGNCSTGTSGVVGPAISLVGTQGAETVGAIGVTVLSNGNYVLGVPNWNGGFGAVVWCNGTTGRTGTISSGIALVGTNSSHLIGNIVVALSNGNYAVASYNWDNGAVSQVGAVTWGNGTTGTTGTVSSANSLIGSKANDQIGFHGMIALNNGNYVVNSPFWDNGTTVDAGAITWRSGTGSATGVVSNINSLVGSNTNDQIGSNDLGLPGITPLSNGNYVIHSLFWDNGTIVDAGAVTWGNGSTGTSGTINSSNSLVGSVANDKIGNGGIFVLPSGNYVVSNWSWDNGAIVDAGAVTWGNGTTGVTGSINSTNSLVGGSTSDQVGYNYNAITVLSNGNYVVKSIYWDNGATTDAGAATWGNGATGTVGLLSSSNSLIGNSIGDNIGSAGIVALNNGNYVVSSPNWDNGATTNVGAVTWCNGSVSTASVVNSSNSYIGTSADDLAGSGGTTALINGNYVIKSPNWDNGAAVNAGAATWCGGSMVSGIVGTVNSLVGNASNDNVSSGNVSALSNGNYIIRSPNWDNGSTTNSGAVTIANGATGLTGTVNTCNSVLGTIANGGSQIMFAYNYTYDHLAVGRRSDNIVTIFDPTGMLLANTMDQQTVNISGSNTVPLLASTGCRIIGTITPNGASPVNGSVTAKAWIEPLVPTFGGEPFVARHYEITPANNSTTATGRVTLYFTQQEFTDFNDHPTSALDLPTGPSDVIGIENLRIGKYGGISNDGSGLPGTYPGTIVVLNPDDVDIVWKNSLSRWEISFDVAGFSGFIVQTKPTVLPLAFLEFNGHLSNNNGILNWKTTAEYNTHSFDVERSIDGRIYTSIGNVSALNQPGINSYTFTDNDITSLGVSVVYYRIKQKNIGGRAIYTGIVALSIDKAKTFVLFYPNPAITKANLTITLNSPEQLVLKIIDNSGRIVQQQQLKLSAGSSVIQVDLENISKGVYHLEIKGEVTREHISFVKQ